MPCYAPLRGFKSLSGGITWSPSQGYVDVPMTVPCGQCIGCRLERARQWSVRMMHEASLHESNCFVTLTYDDEHVPRDGSLVKRHFQLFMKRLRAKFMPDRISFFHCGEYGDDNGRPHYHAILFGCDFPDRVLWCTDERGYSLWTSEVLTSLWRMGLATFGEVTTESAGYVARYSLKKVLGDAAADHYMRVSPEGEVYWLQSEYATMSLKPAIGKNWFEEFSAEVVAYDACAVGGQLQRPPRYYDKQRGKRDMRLVKLDRKIAAAKHGDSSDERLKVKEEVMVAKLQSLRRKV